MSEKPLHVRVAEALGWTWKHSPSGNCRWLCPPTKDNRFCIEPDTYLDAAEDALTCSDGLRYVPRYDTDWSATGPLIGRYAITLTAPHVPGDPWLSLSFGNTVGYGGEVEAEGDTALRAVCNLILALHAAGKLAPPLSGNAKEGK